MLTKNLAGTGAKSAETKPVDAPAADAKKDDGKKDNRKKPKPDAKPKGKNPKGDKPVVSAAPPAPTTRVPAHVRKVTADELTFCLSRVRLALTGRDTPLKKNEKPEPGALLAAASDANTRTFIDELVKKVDAMLAITMGKLEYAEMVAELGKVRTELEQWLKPAAAAATAENATAAAEKPRKAPVTDSSKGGGAKDAGKATVGSKEPIGPFR
jgi:hypothetical protein